MTAPTANLNWITNFIWGIADDVLRDVYVRGKYRDVILPMCVLRRLDAVLEPTKKRVLATKAMLDEAGITGLDEDGKPTQFGALCAASGQAFYNTSKFTLRDLRSRHLAAIGRDFPFRLGAHFEQLRLRRCCQQRSEKFFLQHTQAPLNVFHGAAGLQAVLYLL